MSKTYFGGSRTRYHLFSGRPGFSRYSVNPPSWLLEAALVVYSCWLIDPVKYRCILYMYLMYIYIIYIYAIIYICACIYGVYDIYVCLSVCLYVCMHACILI
jgi:hypothetical protein